MIRPITLKLGSRGSIGTATWRQSPRISSSSPSLWAVPLSSNQNHPNLSSAFGLRAYEFRLASSKSSSKSSASDPSAEKPKSKSVSINNNVKIDRSDALPGRVSKGGERTGLDQSATMNAASMPKPTPISTSPDLLSKVPTETSSSSFASQMLDLASDQPPPPPDQKTGARSKLTGKRPLSSIEKRRQVIGRLCGSLVFIAVGLWGWSLGREWDNEDEKRMLGGGEDGDRISRTRARLFDLFDYFNKPAWNPILPPPLPEPHGRPYTLLVDLDDMLVHSGWDREHGWRTAKRPGVDYFLSYLSQFYEIIIFTTQPAYTAAPIIEKLDPYGYYSPYKIFKEACRSKGILNPQLIKDLDYLGRDLRKVVYLETKPSLVQLHPHNGFIIPPWDGKSTDSGLVDMIPLLEAIVFNGVQDVRDVVQAYEGRDPVKAYAESEARQKKVLLDKWQAQQERRKSGWYIDFGALFGLNNSNPDEPPKLVVEKDRARAQQAYLEEQKYWKENEASFKKLMEEDRERQLAEMKGSLLGFITGQNTAPPSPTSSSDSSSNPSSPSVTAK
ncbi:HAD-like domain-containing protein [Melampsora americana]|nr:HAD-like domain-containing protein [Melampsora americana]